MKKCICRSLGPALFWSPSNLIWGHGFPTLIWEHCFMGQRSLSSLIFGGIGVCNFSDKTFWEWACCAYIIGSCIVQMLDLSPVFSYSCSHLLRWDSTYIETAIVCLLAFQWIRDFFHYYFKCCNAVSLDLYNLRWIPESRPCLIFQVNIPIT